MNQATQHILKMGFDCKNAIIGCKDLIKVLKRAKVNLCNHFRQRHRNSHRLSAR
jgi:hypothetical protein